MAIIGERLRVTLRYTFLGQKCQTAQCYTPGGAAFVTANADGVGEAWWNEVKGVWRDLFMDDPLKATFDTVFVEELDGNLSAGEYAIPSGERDGTRATTSDPIYLPSYCAVGCRLTVPTRITRPGQKRFPGLTQSDVDSNVVDGGFLALCELVAEKYSQVLNLGAPVALGVLVPHIEHYDPDTGAYVSRQDVSGYVLNSFVTSQVSRRYGHGV